MLTEQEQPFDTVPSGIEIARYFLHHTDRQNGGYDGIDLYRDGGDYCYLWVEAFIDLEFFQGWLLEIRTKIDVPPGELGETRDYLAVVAGPLGMVEVEWYNNPVEFADPEVDHWIRLSDGLMWLVGRLEMVSDHE